MRNNEHDIDIFQVPGTPVLGDEVSFSELQSTKSEKSNKTLMKSPTLGNILKSEDDYDVNKLILKANASPDHENCTIDGKCSK